MKRLQLSTIFVLGYVAGLGTYLAVYLTYLAPISGSTLLSQLEMKLQTGPTYAAICKSSTHNTIGQEITTVAQQWTGQQVNGWRGWIHGVAKQADGTYNLEISVYGRGLFWRPDVIVKNIGDTLASKLDVEQPVVFSGRIARVENTFGVMCNPLVIDGYVVVQ